MRRVLIAIGAHALSIALASGCGDDDGGGATYTGGPVARSELPELLANGFCKALRPCCEQAGHALDADACRSSISFALADSISAADERKYTYDADAAGACVGALQGVESACSDQEQPAISRGGLCNGAFAGSVPPGGTCTSEFECATPADGSADCQVEGDATSGICVVESTAGRGDPCYWTCTEKGSGRTCHASNAGLDVVADQPRCFTNDGLYCAADGRCAARAALNEACEDSAGCVDGSFCDGATCRALLAEGERCSFEGCSEGLFCKDGACTPLIAIGAACEPFRDECEGGNSCDDSGTCMEGGELSDAFIGVLCAAGGG